MNEDESGGFKIKDRRRFDSAGNERAGVEPSVKSVAPAVSQPAQAAKATPTQQSSRSAAREKPQAPQSAGAADSEISFSSFIVSLATQALMQLGEMEAPPGVDLPLDLAAGRQTIEIIAMLHQKTRGNLEKAEEQMMEEILHNLRMCFVRATKKVQPKQ